MLQITTRLPQPAPAEASLTLPFEMRQKSRLRTLLDDGTGVALLLDTRGVILRGGDCLRADNGWIIEVRAALEAVSVARSEDAQVLARACYHLGNRHVPVQIGDGWACWLHDHVLDEMVRQLGLTVSCEQAPFEPEAGAYAHHGHALSPLSRHSHGQ